MGWTFILHHLGILFISLCLGKGADLKPIKIGRYCETFYQVISIYYFIYFFDLGMGFYIFSSLHFLDALA